MPSHTVKKRAVRKKRVQKTFKALKKLNPSSVVRKSEFESEFRRKKKR